MYLDEVFNNFLGTLQHVPDIRINNPGLEQGKYVNDRSRHYAAKSVVVGGGDGSNGCNTLTLQKPDLELIERSSGPEYGTVNEGFRSGLTVEGYGGGGYGGGAGGQGPRGGGGGGGRGRGGPGGNRGPAGR